MRRSVRCPRANASQTSKNRRRNPSILIRYRGSNILIDCGKTFRESMLRTWPPALLSSQLQRRDIGAQNYSSRCTHNHAWPRRRRQWVCYAIDSGEDALIGSVSTTCVSSVLSMATSSPCLCTYARRTWISSLPRSPTSSTPLAPRARASSPRLRRV